MVSEPTAAAAEQCREKLESDAELLVSYLSVQYPTKS
jgi:hypothetical protein